MAITKEKALELYATKGATPAAEAAHVSKRTIQRWAKVEGLDSGYDPASRITTSCPSSAEYARGCRCEGCKEANREMQREIKARRLERVSRGKRKVPHGVSGYSNWDCRCSECKKAWSSYLRGRRNPSAAVPS
jgi:hypothetical protein